MSRHVGTSFPAGAMTGDDFFQTTSRLIYRFTGAGDSLDPLNWYVDGGSTASDPDTTGWGNNQRGSHWYNFSEQNYKGWNGAEIVLIG